MILYSIVDPKLSDLYTLSHSKLLENHTLHSGTYLYSPYTSVTPARPLNRSLEQATSRTRVTAFLTDQ